MRNRTRETISSTALASGVLILSAVTARAASAQTNPLQWLGHKLQAQQPASQQTPPATSTPPAPAGAVPPIRSASSARALFAKGTVTGEDLKMELEALRVDALDAKLQHSLAQQIGASSKPAQPASQGGFNPLGLLKQSMSSSSALIESQLLGALLSKSVASSDSALSDFLTRLTGDDDALRSETITLPSSSAAQMTPQQQQSVLVMAALVVAARIAHKTLDAAQTDFRNLETGYAALLKQREQAAALMADVLDRRRQALAARDEAKARALDASLSQWLSPADVTYIDSFDPNRSFREFADDLGMQNLAVKFLQRTDPQQYASYVVQRNDLVHRTRAYVRTLSGVAAFGAFSALFTREIIQASKGKSTAEIFASLPFVADYLKEAGPLIRLSANTLYTGIVLEPEKAQLTYRLGQGAHQTDVRRSKDVFDALNTTGDAHLLTDALFRSETPGFIYRVYLCDRSEAGHLIDQAVPDSVREQFAESYLDQPSGTGFLFANALADDSGAAKGRNLAEQLLSSDQRVSADSVPIGEVQKATAGGYAQWDNSQLTRLILANSEGTYAQMRLGNTVIGLVPSMSTIYAYEDYVDSCNRTANGTQAGGPSSKITGGNRP